MTKKSAAITAAVLFLAGLLVGFFPQYQRASQLSGQLETTQFNSKLARIRELAALSYVDAATLNYGLAKDDTQRMFSAAQDALNQTKDDTLRSSLNDLLGFKTTVEGKLGAADPSVLGTLQQIVQKARSELTR